MAAGSAPSSPRRRLRAGRDACPYHCSDHEPLSVHDLIARASGTIYIYYKVVHGCTIGSPRIGTTCDCALLLLMFPPACAADHGSPRFAKYDTRGVLPGRRGAAPILGCVRPSPTSWAAFLATSDHLALSGWCTCYRWPPKSITTLSRTKNVQTRSGTHSKSVVGCK